MVFSFMRARFQHRNGFLVCLLLLTFCGRAPDFPAPVAEGAAPLVDGVEKGPGRDVILITVDTLRADGPGFSGAGKAETPVWDRMAAQAAVFSFAHAHAVTTLPSHCSIFTGLYPYQHGVRDNAGFVLDDRFATLTGILKGAGYRTGAFISAFPLDARFGLNRGFEVYDDQYQGFGKQDFVFAERPGSETLERAIRWFESMEGQPRFLWLHLFTPHFPYEPEEPFATRYRDRPYYGEVATTDKILGPFLTPMIEGRTRPAILVFTSDHGEGLGEHGELTHGTFAYESTLKIPLFFWAPGLIEPGTFDLSARHIDILPSLLHLLDLPFPDDLPGRSLFSKPSPGTDGGVYFEALMTHLNQGWAPLQGRIEHGFKSIRLPQSEIYDLKNDPEEKANLVQTEVGRMEAAFTRIPAVDGADSQRQQLTQEEMEMLQSLGYAASDSASANPETGPDPKDMIEADQMLKRALDLFHQGKQEAAVNLLRNTIDRFPSFEPAYSDLAFILQSSGNPTESVSVLKQAVAAGIQTEGFLRTLALALAQVGAFQEGYDILFPWRESADPDTRRALGKMLAGLGRFAEAEAAFLGALELDSTNPDAHVDLGTLYLGGGQADKAREQFQLGLEQDPANPRAWNGFGITQARSGNRAAAKEAFEKAIQADANFADGYLNLARIFLAMEEKEQAVETLHRGLGERVGVKREKMRQMLAQLQ